MSTEEAPPAHCPSPSLNRSGLLALLGVGLITALAVAGLASLGDTCANDQVLESFSPNGQLKAVTYRRNCGATSDYSTHVSILPVSQQLPNKSGNVFVVSHEPDIAVSWLDDRHLRITGSPASAASRHLTELGDVQITCE